MGFVGGFVETQQVGIARSLQIERYPRPDR